MIEAWLPAILGIVIVIGMVTSQAWRTLLSEGLPMLRDWAVHRHHAADRAQRVDSALPSPPELARRIEHLEEQVHFIESLLQQTQQRAPSRSNYG